MRVKEVADLAAISVRTLHHYDEIGLLTPDEVTEAGYRIYSEKNLERLQEILFFRELDVPLKQIKEIMNAPDYDRRSALEMHRRLLIERRQRLDQLIETIDKTLKHEKGEIEMSNKEKFKGFDFSHNPYEQEARERWGDEAVDRSNEAIGKMSKEDIRELQDEMNAIYAKLAALRHGSPESEEAQAAIGEWFKVLNRFGSYSLEAFRNIGQMYVDDERFTKNIDQFGEGLAVFMRDAMAVYADQRSES